MFQTTQYLPWMPHRYLTLDFIPESGADNGESLFGLHGGRPTVVSSRDINVSLAPYNMKGLPGVDYTIPFQRAMNDAYDSGRRIYVPDPGNPYLIAGELKSKDSNSGGFAGRSIHIFGDTSFTPGAGSGTPTSGTRLDLRGGLVRTITGASVPSRTISDGVTTNGSNKISSNTAIFTDADIQRTISGTGVSGIVAAYNDVTHATLSTNSTATATGVALTISGSTTLNGSGFSAAEEGCYITGPGFRPGTQILTYVSASQVIMNQTAEAASGLTITLTRPKIFLRGSAANCKLHDITLCDLGPANPAPIIQTNGTTLDFDGVTIAGNVNYNGATCRQPPIIFGGLKTTNDGSLNAPFSGYRSSVRNCTFDRVGSMLVRTFANAVDISDNYWTFQCGEAVGNAAIILQGTYQGELIGCTITGNLIESDKYTSGIKVLYSSNNWIAGNGYWDGVTMFNQGVYFDAQSFRSFVLHFYKGSNGIAVADMNGTNTVLNAESRDYKFGNYLRITGSGLTSTFPSGSTITLQVDNGLGTNTFINLLRAFRLGSGTWVDSVASSFWQNGDQYHIISGASAAVLNRFGVTSAGSVFSDRGQNQLPVPVAVLQADTIGNRDPFAVVSNQVKVFYVSADGNLHSAPRPDTLASGIAVGFDYTKTLNQSGTAGSTFLRANRIETALGSGTHNWFDLQIGGSSKFTLSTAGSITKFSGNITSTVAGITLTGAGAFVASDGTNNQIRALNFAAGAGIWIDSQASGFWQSGLANHIFSGPSGVPFTRFGITAVGTTIHDGDYSTMPAPVALLDIETRNTGRRGLIVNQPTGSTANAAEFRVNGTIISRFGPDGVFVSAGNPNAFQSVAALKAMPSPNPYQAADTSGYYAPGDGGGARYYFDATDTTSTDNGGTVLAPTSSASGRWKLRIGDNFNVRQFGAKGDGTTDDTTAIINAISAATTAGGTVYFPSGKYVISSTLAIPNNIILSGNSFVNGNFATSVLFLKAGSNVDMLRNTSYPSANSGITIKNLYFDGNKANNTGSATTGDCIRISTNWLYLDRVWCVNAASDGIALESCNAVKLDNCRTASCAGHGVVAGTSTANTGGISHTYINHDSELNGGSGFLIQNTQSLSNYSIVGCYTESCNIGIDVRGSGVTVLGGKGSSNTVADIQIADSTSAHHFKVSGFVAQSAPSSANIVIGASALGVEIDNCFYTSLTNNASADQVFLINRASGSSFSITAPVLSVTTLALRQSSTAPAVATSGTISTTNVGTSRVAPSGAVTGIILQAGIIAGQRVTVINESIAANSITFATSGTSNVADGTSDIIPGLAARTFVWNSVTSLWYRDQ